MRSKRSAPVGCADLTRDGSRPAVRTRAGTAGLVAPHPSWGSARDGASAAAGVRTRCNGPKRCTAGRANLLCLGRYGSAIAIDEGDELFRPIGEKLKSRGIQRFVQRLQQEGIAAI